MQFIASVFLYIKMKWLFLKMQKIIYKLSPTDIIVLSYIVITSLICLIGFRNLNHLTLCISVRILTVFIIAGLIKLNSNHKVLHFIRNFYPLILLGYYYNETAILNHLFFNNIDPVLYHLENFIFGFQPAEAFSKVFYYKWFSELMHFTYFSYYTFTFLLLVLIFIKKKQLFQKYLFIIVGAFFIYYLIFALVPSVGPQFYFPAAQQSVPKGYLFEGLMEIITRYAESETGAFPSSHIGMMCIFIFIAYKEIKSILALIILFFILMLFATVYLKAHYVIDLIGGIASAPLIYFIVSSLWNKFFDNSDYF